MPIPWRPYSTYAVICRARIAGPMPPTRHRPYGELIGWYNKIVLHFCPLGRGRQTKRWQIRQPLYKFIFLFLSKLTIIRHQYMKKYYFTMMSVTASPIIDSLFNSLFRLSTESMKVPYFRPMCKGNPSVTGAFPQCGQRFHVMMVSWESPGWMNILVAGTNRIICYTNSLWWIHNHSVQLISWSIN